MTDIMHAKSKRGRSARSKRLWPDYWLVCSAGELSFKMINNKCTAHVPPGIFCPFENKIHKDLGYIFTPYKKINLKKVIGCLIFPSCA